MNWFVEQPLVIVFLGVGICLALGAAWSNTGRKELLYALGLVLLLTVAGVAVSNAVVTDREAIRTSVLQIAAAVQRNDRTELYKHIHSSASELKRKAEAELPNYQFTECRVTRFHKIDVDRSAEPHSAIVEFNVVATGTFKHDDPQRMIMQSPADKSR
jgi:hypothetical protein